MTRSSYFTFLILIFDYVHFFLITHIWYCFLLVIGAETLVCRKLQMSARVSCAFHKISNWFWLWWNKGTANIRGRFFPIISLVLHLSIASSFSSWIWSCSVEWIVNLFIMVYLLLHSYCYAVDLFENSTYFCSFLDCWLDWISHLHLEASWWEKFVSFQGCYSYSWLMYAVGGLIFIWPKKGGWLTFYILGVCYWMLTF